jgi:acetyl-CoA carboxylase biotin carboxyl carrier protein
MIDIRKLKELVRLMVENDLTELDLRDSEEQVTVRRPNAYSPPVLAAPSPHGVYHAPAIAPSPPAPVSSTVTEVEDLAGLHRIESPMVGTFYSAANPESPPFVAVGADVTPDKTVCIIEAMKIFNEIKAECSGTIEKVLVKNGEPVEFGQALFLVRPA